MSSVLGIGSGLELVSATERELILINRFRVKLVSILREYYGVVRSSQFVRPKDKLSVCSRAGKGLTGRDLDTMLTFFGGVSSNGAETAIKIKPTLHVKVDTYETIVGNRDETLSGLIKFTRALRDKLNEKKTRKFFGKDRAVVGYLNSLIKEADRENAEILKERDAALLDRTIALNDAKSDIQNLMRQLDDATLKVAQQRREIEGLSVENQEQKRVIAFLSETLSTVSALLKKAQETASYEEGAKQAAHVNKQIMDLQKLRNAMMEQLTLIEGHLLSIRTKLESVGNGLNAVRAGIDVRNEEIVFTFDSTKQAMDRLGKEFASKKVSASSLAQQKHVRFQKTLILDVCKNIDAEVAAYQQRVKNQWFSSLRKGGRKLKKLEELAKITKKVAKGMQGEDLELGLPYKMYKLLEEHAALIIGSFGDDSLAGGQCLLTTNNIEKSVATLAGLPEVKLSEEIDGLEKEQALAVQALLDDAGRRVIDTGAQEVSALEDTARRLELAHVAVEKARSAIAEIIHTAVPGVKPSGFAEPASSMQSCASSALAAMRVMQSLKVKRPVESVTPEVPSLVTA